MSTIEERGKATTITYDAGGNQLSVRDLNNVGADMHYDARGRNTQRTDNGLRSSRNIVSIAVITKLEFDQCWRLDSATINGTAHTRTHGPTPEQLTSKIGSGSTQNVTHDVKGNMTSIPVNLRESGASTALNLEWDFDNRMKSADINADSIPDVTFTYDALGRRVTRSHSSGSWVFVQSDQQTLCDYVIGQGPSNALYRYVYASYIDEPVVRKETGTSGTILYFHRNQQYSIYAITNSSGAVQERYAYTAYGQPTFLNASGSQISNSAISNRYTYTGREWDQTIGLYYFRARWMSANGGRFLGRDPIGYEGSEWGLGEVFDSNPLVGHDAYGLANGGGQQGRRRKRRNEPNNFLNNPNTSRCIFNMKDRPNYTGGKGAMAGREFEVGSKDEILAALDTNRCCELVFFSHQGNYHNPGGIKGILPDEPFELEVRKRIEKMNCKICGIVSFACGTADIPSHIVINYPKERDENRQKIANNTGCHFFGLTTLTFTAPSPPPIIRYEPGKICTLDKDLHGKPGGETCPNYRYGPFPPLRPYPSRNPIGGTFID